MNMFSCKDVSRKLSEAMEQPQPMAIRFKLRMHLMMCRSCRRFADQIQMLQQIARRFRANLISAASSSGRTTAPATLTAEARLRINRAVKNAQENPNI